MNGKKRLGFGTLFALSLLGGVLLLADHREFVREQYNAALFKAIRSNDAQAAVAALNAGATADARYDGETPHTFRERLQRRFAGLLHRTPQTGGGLPVSALQYALKGGTTPLDGPENSPPFVENAAIVKALLDHGADPNVRGNGRMTPLMRAAIMDWQDSLKLLLQRGADLHARDEDGETALHSAAEATSAENVKLLLAQGADINAQGKDGETPLMLAIYFDRSEILPILLERHPDLNCKDKDGSTALDYAQKRQADDTVALLRKAGAKAYTSTYEPPPSPNSETKPNTPSADVLTLATRTALPDIDDSQDSCVYYWTSDQQLLWIQPDSAHHHYEMNLTDAQTGTKTPLTALNTIARPSMAVIPWGTIGYASTKEVITQYPPPESALSPDGKWLLWVTDRNSSHSWRASTLDGAQQRQWSHLPSTFTQFWLPDSLHWMELVGNKRDTGYDRIVIYPLAAEEKPREVHVEGLDDLVFLGVTDRQTFMGYDLNLSSRRKQSKVKMEEIGLRQKTEQAHSFTIPLPKPAEVDKVLLSPTGDRIAWILSDGVTFTEKGELWISDSVGKNMHLIGRLEGDLAFKRNLHWLPDGKHLSFRHQGDLWTVPAP